MRFFKACIDQESGESFYVKAETWYTARDLARRLYPLEAFEQVWKDMQLLEEAPEKAKGLHVFEFGPEGDPRMVPEYAFDYVAAKKKAQR